MRLHTTLALLAVLGCGRLSRSVPIDPGVNFAAHAERGRIVLDRVPGAHGGLVESAGGIHWSAPVFTVTTEGKPVAELSLTAPATVQVRGADGGGGAVEPSWEDNAIRLTLHFAGDATLKSDLFERTAAGGGPPVLTRAAQSVLDLRGTYRAALRDAKGGEAGWIRVSVSPYAESPRIYDGVLPVEVGPGVAAGTAVALGSEIDWIESHTLDVYRGGTGGGPLRESVPLGR
jgi:hypothetical protein